MTSLLQICAIAIALSLIYASYYILIAEDDRTNDKKVQRGFFGCIFFTVIAMLLAVFQ